MDELIQTVVIAALPVVLAITLHEAAHGYVARLFGDPTAWQAGRVTLNPLKHIDPVGTVLVPAFILLASRFLGSGGLLFGWAKPVPVDFSRLRNPKRDMLWVAAAGPAANLAMALAWGMLFKGALTLAGSPYALPLAEMSRIGVEINLILMVLNLLPLPPLDGGRITVSLLPRPFAGQFARLEPFGMPILLLLLFTGLLGAIIGPLVVGAEGLLIQLLGLAD